MSETGQGRWDSANRLRRLEAALAAVENRIESVTEACQICELCLQSLLSLLEDGPPEKRKSTDE